MACVLFDLDGTLTDSKSVLIASLRHTFEAFGVQANDTELDAYLGPPLLDALQSLAGLDEHTAREAVGVFRRYYTAGPMFECPVYDGIPEVLDALVAAGARLAVATSKVAGHAEAILRHVGLLDRFDIVAGAEEDGSVRHKDEVVGVALRALESSAGSATRADGARPMLMVGDREHDVLGARRWGLSTVGAGWGYAAPGELEAAGALLVVSTPAELLVELARHLKLAP